MVGAGKALTKSVFVIADAAAERLRDKMRERMLARLAEAQPRQLCCTKWGT